jgi:hypothetical protein
VICQCIGSKIEWLIFQTFDAFFVPSAPQGQELCVKPAPQRFLRVSGNTAYTFFFRIFCKFLKKAGAFRRFPGQCSCMGK